MQFIPTTATAVQKIKLAAKAIARTTGVSHTKALEQVSKAHGYEGWYHVQQCQKTTVAPEDEQPSVMNRAQAASAYFDYLAAQLRSPVLTNAIKDDIFHDVTIEEHRFVGKVMSTGDIHLFKLRSGFDIDYAPSIQIGSASIRKVDAGGAQKTAPSEFHQTTSNVFNPLPHGAWWICKYDENQGYVDLGSMSEHGRNALAHEFGLPHIPHGDIPRPTDPWYRFARGDEDALFFMSPAYHALVHWAKLHPGKARSSSGKSIHLRNWLNPTF